MTPNRPVTATAGPSAATPTHRPPPQTRHHCWPRRVPLRYGTRLHSTPALLPRVCGMTRQYDATRGPRSARRIHRGDSNLRAPLSTLAAAHNTWRQLAEGAPDDDYLHRYFEPTARSTGGLEKVLAGLLDDALTLDLRKSRDPLSTASGLPPSAPPPPPTPVRAKTSTEIRAQPTTTPNGTSHEHRHSPRIPHPRCPGSPPPKDRDRPSSASTKRSVVLGGRRPGQRRGSRPPSPIY
jgi:hypothetical protein